MAGQLGEVFLAITGRDMGLKAALSKAEAETRTGTASMSTRLTQIAGTMARIGAAIGIANIARNAVNEAMAAEDAQMGLVAALAASGEATEANIKRFSDFAAQMQATTRAEDDTVIAGMAQMRNMGIQTSQLEGASKAAIVLSTVMHMDLGSAFQAVGAASNGQVRAFSRLIPGLKDAGDAHQKFAMILDWGSRKFGIAEAAAQTTAGKFEQFKNAVGNLYETIGALLTPALVVVTGVLKGFAEWFTSLGSGTVATILGIVGVATAIYGIIRGIMALKAAYDALKESQVAAAIAARLAANPVLGVAAAAAVVAAVAAGIYGVNKLMGDSSGAIAKLQNEMNQAMDNAKKSVDQHKAAVSADSKQATDDSKSELEKTQDKYKAYASRIAQRIGLLKQQREAEEQAKQSAIGWTSLGDVWRNAMTVGLKQQFNATNVNTGGGNWNLTGASESQIKSAMVAENEANRRNAALIDAIQRVEIQVGKLSPEAAMGF